MDVRKVRLTIQEMTWERCVSRVEGKLKSLRGVLKVKGGLKDGNLGEAVILYDPAELTVESLRRVVPMASGKRHNFKVISVVDLN